MSFLDRLRRTDPTSVSPEEFARGRRPEDIVLDVRTPAEYAAGHADGAILMDVSDSRFGDRAAGLDRTKTYYLYCRSGSRSAHATSILRSLGVENAFNIGGLDGLARAGVALAHNPPGRDLR